MRAALANLKSAGDQIQAFKSFKPSERVRPGSREDERPAAVRDRQDVQSRTQARDDPRADRAEGDEQRFERRSDERESPFAASRTPKPPRGFQAYQAAAESGGRANGSTFRQFA